MTIEAIANANNDLIYAGQLACCAPNIESVKHCPHCDQDKPLDQFNRNRARSDGRQYLCRECQNARDIGDYYIKPGRKEAIRRNTKRWNADQIVWYRSLKAHPCTDCRVSYPYYVMHWDHIGTDKEFNISTMKYNFSRVKILAEVAKCELVCANCHAVRTFVRRAHRVGSDPTSLMV